MTCGSRDVTGSETFGAMMNLRDVQERPEGIS